jgi:hypothetical protein
MWQNFLDLWASSKWFRGALALFVVGLYVNFM